MDVHYNKCTKYPMSDQIQRPENETLMTEPGTTTYINKKQPFFQKHKHYIFFIFLAFLALIGMFVIQTFFTTISPVVPIRVGIPWFADRPIILQLGTSRVLQPLLYSGYDDRTNRNYKTVTQRQIQWTVDPPGIVNIDLYGRIDAIKQGTCILKLRSLANRQATDQRNVTVVRKRNDTDKVPRRVINYKGQAADVVINLQKIVQRFSKQQVIQNPDVPESVKYAAQHPTQTYPTSVVDVGTTYWSIVQYQDGSKRKYVFRENATMAEGDRDKYQYFMGDRYLPDQGTSPVMLQSDGSSGIWVVGQSGNSTHIRMVSMTHSQKAQMMVQQTQKYVMRHGMASGAYLSGGKWIPEIADNDGLWTAMYGSGELMKYAVLKQRKADAAQVAKARERALKSLKAVLMIANVAGREGKVKAKIRHLNNTRAGDGVFYSKQYLLEGKQNQRDVYVGRPSDGVGFYGVDADKTINGNYLAGSYKYSMLPLIPQDWSTTGPAATTQRNLDGFMCRTFIIPAIDPPVPGGLFFRRHANNTHSVLSGAHTLYDYTKDQHPDLQLGNKPIPQALRSYLNINGTQYNASDLVYKADTSTDQVIGHLFIYKIAYDILDDNDNQQRQLKQLIRQTMRNFAQHLINNGYSMVDATGQATKWTKLYKQFYTTDYTIQDAPLKAIQMLLSLKLAYYVTGQRKFKDEYDLLANDQLFRYIDLVGLLWDRYVWVFTNTDDSQFGSFKLDYSLNPSFVEIQRHTIYNIHFSDQEQAFLAYYLAFQLEEDPATREKYRKGIDSYWHSISRSQNPLWYYIYQLSQPQHPVKDAFGQDLREVAAWQLSRHMIDTTKYQAFIKGSRKDVIFQKQMSVNPKKVVGTRTSKSDEKFVSNKQNFEVFPQFNPNNIYEIKVLPADQRSIHKFNGATFQNIDGNHSPTSMEPSTTFTLPYWLGVYHGLIKYD